MAGRSEVPPGPLGLTGSGRLVFQVDTVFSRELAGLPSTPSGEYPLKHCPGKATWELTNLQTTETGTRAGCFRASHSAFAQLTSWLGRDESAMGSSSGIKACQRMAETGLFSSAQRVNLTNGFVGWAATMFGQQPILVSDRLFSRQRVHSPAIWQD